MISQNLKLKVLPLAAREIVEQAAYYRLKENERLADRWYDAVDSAMESLRNLPERGSIVRAKSPALQKVRQISIDGFPKHFLFYRVDLNIHGHDHQRSSRRSRHRSFVNRIVISL